MARSSFSRLAFAARRPTRIILLLVGLLSGCSQPAAKVDLPAQEIPESTGAYQRMMLSHLTGHSAIPLSDGTEVTLNSRWNSREKRISRSYLKHLIEDAGLVAQEHRYVLPNSAPAVDLLIEPLRGVNLYTVLPAVRDTNEYVVVGAHYDTDGSGFPGALDNGSGVALISAVLRQLAKVETRNRNLIVVYFDQEEESVSAGSIAFARFLKAQDYDVHSVHSFDLIGWDSDHNREVSLALPNAEIEALYKKHAQRLGIPLYVIDSTSSDYYSFISEGINAVGISQAYTKGDVSGLKDSPKDVYELINFAYLESSTQLAAAVLKELIDG